MLADLFTPIGAYMRLRDLFPQSVLMECSDYRGGGDARSYIGIGPMASVEVGHGVARLRMPDGADESRGIGDGFSVADAVRSFIDAFEVEGDGHAGLFGYTTFNAVRYLEGIDVRDETHPRHDAPDILYILFRTIVEFDHFNNRVRIASLVSPDARAASGVQDVLAALRRSDVRPFGFRPVGPVSSPLTDEQHKANIRKGIAHCLRGDVFQVVLSRRFSQRYEGDDFKLYRALRSINPSPYLFYMDMGGFRIFGSSPETHCRVDGRGRRAYIDPIAGTARRSGDPEADARAADALLADPKENAEHVMLVDLARNDLSRNCHDVDVLFFKDLQYYSHVIHLVSRVGGTLDDGADPIRVFFDTFPAGTLSGAPKVRAMQIISQVEPHNRGAYGGCVGSIGFDGSLNQAITIRTFVSRGGELWFQAGGGIVAKSDAEAELQEVNNKLAALRRAIELAETM